MANIPVVPPIDKFSDMMDLLHNDNLYGKRLKALQEIHELIAKDLVRYNKIKNIESLQNKANETMAAALQAKKEAEDYCLKLRAQGDADMQKAKKAAEEVAAKTRTDMEAARVVARDAQVKMLEAEKLSRQAEQKIKEAIEIKNSAESLMETATGIKRTFEDRLKKVQEAVQ